MNHVLLECIMAASWQLHSTTDACNGHLLLLLFAAGAEAEPSALRLPLGDGGDETLLLSMPERPFSSLAELPGDLVNSLLAQTGKGTAAGVYKWQKCSLLEAGLLTALSHAWQTLYIDVCAFCSVHARVCRLQPQARCCGAPSLPSI
jgi:hypothetical protein